MPKKYTLNPQAIKDLEDIYQYSCNHWGEEQAAQYIRDIDKAFISLTTNDKAGHDFSFVRPGLRAFHLKSHSIYYRLSNSGIVITRFLHHSMDSPQHLDK
jgi:toxin ParE1/3/4